MTKSCQPLVLVIVVGNESVLSSGVFRIHLDCPRLIGERGRIPEKDLSITFGSHSCVD